VPFGTESMGYMGSKKAYSGPRTGIYLPTKFGCDRPIVVGCRSRNDRQTNKPYGHDASRRRSGTVLDYGSAEWASRFRDGLAVLGLV